MFSSSANFIGYVYSTSFIPIGLAAINLFLYCIRALFFGPNGNHIYSQHSNICIMIAFLTIPVCTMVQLKGLWCFKLDTGVTFLLADPSIDCSSNQYKVFFAMDCLLISIFQSIPIALFISLHVVSHRLNPINESGEVKRLVISKRSTKSRIRSTTSLWETYEPSYWFYDLIDM
jgi:hypothetical protein